jgi:antitoxin HicB
MKTLEQYLSLNYKTSVYRDDDGDFIVEATDLPGCVADGKTPNEAFENLRKAMRSWIGSRIEAGLDVPEPRSAGDFSGRVLLRMPRYLHQRLSAQAESEGTSLNQYMVSLLSQASTTPQLQPAIALGPTVGWGQAVLNSGLATPVSGWQTRFFPTAGSYVTYNYDSLLESNVACSVNQPGISRVTVSQEARKEPVQGPQLVPKQQVA